MKKQTTAIIVNTAVIVLMALAIGGVVMGISHTTSKLSVEIKENNVEAVLANANVRSNTSVAVPVLFYDQKMDACVDFYNLDLQDVLERRQFEWKSCGYYNLGIETGLVETTLNEQYLPVAVGGELLSNRGLADGFTRWFSPVDGLSKSYAGVLELSYNAEDASFEYVNEEFYPLDELDSASEESVNKDGHNHLFTMSLGVPFQVLANGKEVFTVVADDDTWVFIGDTLILDMGGIHETTTGRFKIDNDGGVYVSVEGEDFVYSGINLVKNEGTIARIFHADRNSGESVFKISLYNMMPNILNTTLAKNGSVEVAYDPADPSYVAPLGESMTVKPDRSRSLTTAIAIQMMLVCGLGVLLVVFISVAYRYLRRDHSQVE